MLCSFSYVPHLVLTIIITSSLPISSTNQHATTIEPNTIIDPLELETLFEIMETLSSDLNWRVSYPNACRPGSSWHGIECKHAPTHDNHLHVARLDFGTPPNPSCKKSATFPSQIFRLPHLESIFIFNCFTHTPTKILVPPNKPINSPLQQLSFRSNSALVGPIPPQLSSLKSLQILTLSQNRLTGPIPVEILNLNSLVHLDLSFNALTGPIPIHIGRLENLVGLDLSYNNLVGPIPTTIGELRALQKLDLSSNSLTGRIPNTIEHLQSLVFFALSNNRLRGDFPAGFKSLRNLQYFLMDDNPMFIPLPVEFGQLKKLQELRLSNSGYSGTIPSAYSQLVNLSSLSLQNNRLSGQIPPGFANLSHVYHMNLSRNSLGGIAPFDSGFLSRLGRNLDLSGNPELCLSAAAVNGGGGGGGANSIINGVGVCGKRKPGSIMEKSDIAPLRCSYPCLLLVNVVLVFFMTLHHGLLCFG